MIEMNEKWAREIVAQGAIGTTTNMSQVQTFLIAQAYLAGLAAKETQLIPGELDTIDLLKKDLTATREVVTRQAEAIEILAKQLKKNCRNDCPFRIDGDFDETNCEDCEAVEAAWNLRDKGTLRKENDEGALERKKS